MQHGLLDSRNQVSHVLAEVEFADSRNQKDDVTYFPIDQVEILNLLLAL